MCQTEFFSQLEQKQRTDVRYHLSFEELVTLAGREEHVPILTVDPAEGFLSVGVFTRHTVGQEAEETHRIQFICNLSSLNKPVIIIITFSKQ